MSVTFTNMHNFFEEYIEPCVTVHRNTSNFKLALYDLHQSLYGPINLLLVVKNTKRVMAHQKHPAAIRQPHKTFVLSLES